MSFHHFLIAFAIVASVPVAQNKQFSPDTDLFQQTLTRLNFPDHQFLDVNDFRHRTKRQEPVKAEKEIEFNAMGREFHLLLRESMDVISPGFRIYTMNANGTQVPYNGFDVHEYYTGRVVGAATSQVTAHVDSETGLLTASIAQDSDMYFIEPVYSKSPSNGRKAKLPTRMIMYKVNEAELELQSDRHMLHDAISLNESVPFDPELQNLAGEQSHRRHNLYAKRNKRQTNDVESRPTRCTLRLVADHHFFKEHGSDVKQAINYLVTVIDRINQIYLSTHWSEDDPSLTGFGFVVQEILVHEAPSADREHYNSQKDWTIRDVLDAFSRDRNHKWFCLSHLFTHQRFANGVLGLAFVANLRKFVPGGICSQAVTKGQHTYYYNTGVTTTQNSFGRAIFTRVTDLITAHEFGHNWGAEHDPDLEECSPASGGGYLMHTYSLAGYDANNKIFSLCSRRAITEVLRYKSLSCFVSHRKSFCGNGVVDEGEECDSQQISGDDSDPCCSQECRLKDTAKCSDFNHLCCEKCQVKGRGSLCREGNANDCKESTSCDGLSALCPSPAPPVRDGDVCVDQGKCVSGTCVPFCESHGLQSCLCAKQENHCNRCCRNAILNTTCQPFLPLQDLSDGTPCIYGFCESGECKRKSQDVITRVWHFVDNSNTSRFVEFIRDNIVIAVIFLLLAVWIPVTIYFKKLDEKVLLEKNRQREENERLAERNRRVSDRPSGSCLPRSPPARQQERQGGGDRRSGSYYETKRTIHRPYDLTGVAEFDTPDTTREGETSV